MIALEDDEHSTMEIVLSNDIELNKSACAKENETVDERRVEWEFGVKETDISIGNAKGGSLLGDESSVQGEQLCRENK